MKTIGTAVFGLAAFAACTQLPEESPVIVSQEECVLTVNFSGPGTKAVGQTVAMEDAINNVALFVFRTDDGARLDASVYSEITPAVTQAGSGNPWEMSLRCTVGERKVYVLVNVPEDITGSVLTEKDLLSRSSLLVDNGVADFLMMGSENVNVSGPECTLRVPVKRMVASVRLDRITNLMEANAYRSDGMFVVQKIYLTNVVGVMKYDGSTVPSAVASEYWLAKLTAGSGPLICEDDVSTTVNYGEDSSYSTSHSFYAYPNDCPADESEIWCPRSTMLVIEASLNGEKYYYPVPVGPLESNRQYVITDFVIRRPGSAVPWECVHKSAASINVEVMPWGSPVVTREEI